MNLKYPSLIGVDVSGGYQRDSSAITVVDSFSTRVTAELNSNFISTPELARIIYEIVSKWLPNAVVNIERNGVAYTAIAVCRVICIFQSVNCYEVGKELYSPQRDLRRCA